MLCFDKTRSIFYFVERAQTCGDWWLPVCKGCQRSPWLNRSSTDHTCAGRDPEKLCRRMQVLSRCCWPDWVFWLHGVYEFPDIYLYKAVWLPGVAHSSCGYQGRRFHTDHIQWRSHGRERSTAELHCQTPGLELVSRLGLYSGLLAILRRFFSRVSHQFAKSSGWWQNSSHGSSQ